MERTANRRGRGALALTALMGVLLAACTSSSTSSSADAPTVEESRPGTSTSASPAPGDTPPAASDQPAGESEPADSTSEEQGTSDGSTSTGDTADGGTTDGGAADDGGSTDGGTADGGATDGGSTDGGGAEQPPIKLGFAMTGGNAGKAFGVDVSQDEDRVRRWLDAFRDEYNENGGIAGREVTHHAIFVSQDDQSESNQRRLQTEACVEFTEDENVLMVLGDTTRYALDCYVEHQTAVFTPVQTKDTEELKPLRPWILPSYFMVFDRLARLMPMSLADQGFLTAGEKVGVLAFDTPSYHRAIENFMTPEIEKSGAELHEVVYMKIAYDDIAAQLSSAVLRWKSNDVQRVIVFANGGGVWLLFAQNAESQNYRPWYGVSTMDRPFFTADLIPPEQLRNVYGTGFWMTLDIDESEHPPLSPVEEWCFRVVNERAGEDMHSRDVDGLSVLAICDAFRQVAAALEPATGQPLTRADVPRLYHEMGDSYESVVMGPVDFSEHRWDAPTRHRDLTYDTDCSCVKYTSPWQPIPF